MLESMPELTVVGQASDGLEAVQRAVELKPDLILLDIGLPSINGIEAASRIARNNSCASKILFVSENRDADVVTAGVKLPRRTRICFKERSARQSSASVRGGLAR